MVTSVVGAPGSGKTALAMVLSDVLPTHFVLDWDAFMPAAAEFAGRDIPTHSSTWLAYRELVRIAVEVVPQGRGLRPALEVDFDALDLPSTGVLPVSAEGGVRHEHPQPPAAPRPPSPREVIGAGPGRRKLCQLLLSL
jgi:hypothetical protein